MVGSEEGIFRRVNFVDPKHGSLMDQLDSAYRAQVHKIEKDRLSELSSKFHGVVSPTQDQIMGTLEHFADARLRWVNKVSGQPMLVGLGSARDNAVTEYGKKNIWAIANLAVSKNLGIVTGKWCRGYMGVYGESFLTVKKDYNRGWAYSSAVPLLGQESDPKQLEDAPEWYKVLKEEALSPPHASFVARTPDIVVPPQTLGCLFATPGIGTMEEFWRIVLDRQMKDRNLSMFSWRSEDSIPPKMILDEPLGNQSWKWDFLIMLAEMQVQSQTVSQEDYNSVEILRVGKTVEHPDSLLRIRYFENPEKLAEHVVSRAWECHVNLKKHIVSSLSQ